MCGRFTLTKPRSLLAAEAFAGLIDADSPEAIALLEQLEPHFNIAPSQDVLVLPNTDEGPTLMRWGLIPSWAKDEKIGYRTINARAETVASKPAFRRALVKRRCLIPADGFFEWQAAPTRERRGRKQPYYIHRADHQPFAFAGLWEVWRPEGREPVRSCTIITTTPNAVLAPLHDRMPVILPPERFGQWLDPSPVNDVGSLAPLLTACPAEDLDAHPVGWLVNTPAADQPECILPLEQLDAGDIGGDGADGDHPGEDEAPPKPPRAAQLKLFDE